MIRGDLGHVETLPVVVQEPGEGVGHRLRLVVICAAPTQPAIHSLATVSAEMEWQQGSGVANRHLRKTVQIAEVHVQSMQVRSRQH